MNGDRQHPETGGLVMAAFRQATSREDDPQLHSHVVISAKVQTADGRWWALDARTGRLRGRFETGRPLAAGAAFDAATGRLYVPAHGKYVYVFTYPLGADVPGAPRCEGLMATGHAPGALRGQPIVVSGEGSIRCRIGRRARPTSASCIKWK